MNSFWTKNNFYFLFLLFFLILVISRVLTSLLAVSLIVILLSPSHTLGYTCRGQQISNSVFVWSVSPVGSTTIFCMSIKLSNNCDNVHSLFCSPGLGLLKGFILIDHSFKSPSKINDHVVFVDVVVMCSKFNRQPRVSMSCAWANHYLWAGRKRPITTWKGTIEWYLWLRVGALWCMYVRMYVWCLILETILPGFGLFYNTY